MWSTACLLPRLLLPQTSHLAKGFWSSSWRKAQVSTGSAGSSNLLFLHREVKTQGYLFQAVRNAGNKTWIHLGNWQQVQTCGILRGFLQEAEDFHPAAWGVSGLDTMEREGGPGEAQGLHFQFNSDLCSRQPEARLPAIRRLWGHLQTHPFGLCYLWGIRTHLSHVGSHRDLQIPSDGAQGSTAPAVVKASQDLPFPPWLIFNQMPRETRTPGF